MLTNLAIPAVTQCRLPMEQWFNTSAAPGNLRQMRLIMAAGSYIQFSLLSSILRTVRQVSWHLTHVSGLRNG